MRNGDSRKRRRRRTSREGRRGRHRGARASGGVPTRRADFSAAPPPPVRGRLAVLGWVRCFVNKPNTPPRTNRRSRDGATRAALGATTGAPGGRRSTRRLHRRGGNRFPPWGDGCDKHSVTHAPRRIPEAQGAFKGLMIHWILQFALRIAFRCVLHRCGSQDIRR